jgi:hypothetical protein
MARPQLQPGGPNPDNIHQPLRVVDLEKTTSILSYFSGGETRPQFTVGTPCRREYNGELPGVYQGPNSYRRLFVLTLPRRFLMRAPFRLIGGVLIATLLTQVTACGSIFYPDRRGQIDGKIDPVIVALDAVGLLFYIIPGLIAFAVDFATGAIYFEPGKTAQVAPEKLKDAIGADGKVDNHKLQTILETELGRSFPLDDPRLIQHKGSAQQLAMFGLQPAA